jgi:hypothetical protein
LKILLGNLKDKAAELATFLEPRLGTKAKVSGSDMEIEDSSMREGVKPRHVKTYVKRFLFQTGQRKAFRVLVQGRELRIVELELEEVEEGEEKPSKPQEEREEKKEKAEETPKVEEVAEEQEEQTEAAEKKEETKKKPRKKKEPGESG